MRSTLALAVIALISNTSAKHLTSEHNAPIGYIMMQEEPVKEEAKVEAKAEAAPAKVEGAPEAKVEGAEAKVEGAEAKVDGEAKAPAKVAAPAAPAKKPSDGLTVDNSIPNGGYTGMINGRSKFKDATTDEMKGTWSKLNYGPYKKTTGAPDRWERALGRPDDKNMKMPVYGDAGGQNKFTN